MSNRTEARSAKAARMHATGRLPLLRLFSTPLIDSLTGVLSAIAWLQQLTAVRHNGIALHSKAWTWQCNSAGLIS
jgi:hypothetical protein